MLPFRRERHLSLSHRRLPAEPWPVMRHDSTWRAVLSCPDYARPTAPAYLSSCLYRKLDSAIMVMKSAEDRHRCDAAYVLDAAIDRSVFTKRPMSPQLVIISGILRQNPA
jgi:hypothetical protein